MHLTEGVPPLHQDDHPSAIGDLPLRDDPAPAAGDRMPARGVSVADTVRAAAGPVLVTAALALVIGMASGIFIGRELAPPVPGAAEVQFTDIPIDDLPAPDDVGGSAQQDPPYDSGRAGPAERRAGPLDPPSAAAAEPDAPRVERAINRTPMTGSLQVVSRPAGANVFVDGRLVGRTPLALPEVRTGAHAVRIALSGHRRWATSVRVAPGERTRVAASLER